MARAKSVKEELAKAIEESDKEEVIEETTEKGLKVASKKRLTTIPKDLDVIIMNNTNGRFAYTCPRTQNRHDIDTFGDMDRITLAELSTMKNSHKIILDKFWILIIDVDSDEFTVEDVLYYLQLDKLYEEALSNEEIDNLLKKVALNKFEKILKSLNNVMAVKVIERAVMLFREGEFGDSNKMDIMEELVKREDLFKDVRNQEK